MRITTPGAELQQRSHGMGERLRRCRHDDKGPHDDVAGEQADWSRGFDAKVPGGGNVIRMEYGDEEMQNSFWHEVTHAILYDMGHNLHNNEHFVTQFANRLSDAVDSAKL